MRIAIIGSGIVGRATGYSLQNKNNSIYYIDNNQSVVENLKSEGFEAYKTEEVIDTNPDIYLICTPTPTVDNKVSIESTLDSIHYIYRSHRSDHYSLVAIRSTVPTGTNLQCTKLLSDYGLIKDKDFCIISMPEFLREQSSISDIIQPKITLIGTDSDKAFEIISNLYKKHQSIIHRSLPKEAEMQKYVHNLFNACKISFFNEMREVCKLMDIDPRAVFPLVAKSAEACYNPEYGTRDLGRFGGSCLPKDTNGMLHFVKEMTGKQMVLLLAIIEVNNNYGEK